MPDYADRLLEIAECELCDEQGIRLNGLYRCDHIDHGAAAKRGIALCLAELEKAKQK